MKEIYEGRWIARLDEPFVVLLIGIRINKPWHIHRWLPLVFQMSQMLRELNDNGDPGFLGGQTWFGRTTVLIQYWRSIEELEVYSKAKHKNRTPAWETFNRAVEGTDSVGVYHEFYSIEPGRYDNSVRWPPFARSTTTALFPPPQWHMDRASTGQSRAFGAFKTGSKRPAHLRHHPFPNFAPNGPFNRTITRFRMAAKLTHAR